MMVTQSSAKIDRRSFLRGAAGTVIGLPLLECMLNPSGTAYADGSEFPSRYFVFMAPTSLVVSGSRSEGMTPSTTGVDYAITPVLQPLADRGIKNDVTVVSGLFCPPLEAPGGYNVDYHGQGYKAVLSGQRSGWATDGEGWRPQGLSSDEIVADASPDSLWFRKLYFQIDPVAGGDCISFERRQSQGRSFFQAAMPEISPVNAYRTLFQDFVAPGPSLETPLELEQRLRKSSLSYAREQIIALERRLGAADKRALDEHLTHVRELERRIELSVPSTGLSSCKNRSLPANDPADLDLELPDQDARADLFVELIEIAFACDMTRTVTLSSTSRFTGSGMRHAIWRELGGHHGELQHRSAQSALDEANQWFVDVYARTLSKLKNMSEGVGTVLDNTAGVFVMEGGKGMSNDAQRNGDGGRDSNHSCDNMVLLVGGRAGGLTPRGHLSLAGKDSHPAVVLNSAIHAVGVDATLGEIPGTVEQLFS